MIQACSRCGTRWNVRGTNSVLVPALQRRTAGAAPPPRCQDHPLRRLRGRRSLPPAKVPPGGVPLDSRAARPAATHPPSTPARSDPPVTSPFRDGLIDRIEPPADRTAGERVADGGSCHRAGHCRSVRPRGTGAGICYILLLINRSTRRRPWLQRSRRRWACRASLAAIASARHRCRDVMADRPPGRGFRAAWSTRSTAGVGTVGGLSRARRQPGLAAFVIELARWSAPNSDCEALLPRGGLLSTLISAWAMCN